MNYKHLKNYFDSLKSQRSNWDSLYQVAGEYVSLNKQNFEGQPSSGEFLVDDIYDSTAPFAALNASSVLSGMLWAGSAQQSVYLGIPKDLEVTTEVAEFFEYCSDKLTAAFDDPEAGFLLAFEEYLLDQLIFGTSGIGVDAGDKSLLSFAPYGVKELYIDEGKGGRVTNIFLFFEWTVKRVIAEYGIENVSEKVRDAYNNEKYDQKTKILICYNPREEIKAVKGKLSMPIQSVHMEYDNCHVLREGGFADLPIKVCRFRKLNYERYGRSPTFAALPDIKELNILREAVIIATEQILDMPRGVYNDSTLGGGTVDRSAGALNVFNSNSQLGNRLPIFDIGTPPDIRAALSRIEDLKENIGQHFFIDRLLDFNNETQMTLGEAQIRAGRSNASLASLFNRQISECINLVIERGLNLLFEMGELGVVEGSEQQKERIAQGKEFKIIPEEIVKRITANQKVFEVGYRTQAANVALNQEYIAILDATSFALQGMQVDPTLRHRIDMHAAVKRAAEIRGISADIIHEDDKVNQAIEAEQQQMQQQQQLEQAAMGADVVDKLGSADKAFRGA